MQKSFKNYYRILGVSIDAENEEIKAAYRILAQRYHPDKGGDPAEFRLIQEAYDILSNPLTKRAYDRDFFTDKYQSAVTIHTPQNHKPISKTVLFLAFIFALGGTGFLGYSYLKQQNEQKIIDARIMQLQNTIPIDNPSSAPAVVSHKHKVAKKPLASAVVNNNPLQDLQGTNYLLNIASYSTLNSAQSRQQQLKSLGYASAIQKINANSEGLTSYNVFMGPFHTRTQAENMQNKLESQNISSDVQMVDYE